VRTKICSGWNFKSFLPQTQVVTDDFSDQEKHTESYCLLNNKINRSRVFNKGWQPVKLAGYSTRTRHLFDWEITSYFTTNMRNIRHKTRAWDRPRFIHEKRKNLAWILSNFSGDLCFLFCSNTQILAPECRQCILRGPNFQNFLGEHTPWPC